jgi:hypothetical protein
MDEKQLLEHKRSSKRLSKQPLFKPLKRRTLPKPLHQVGGPRLHGTAMLPVGGNYEVCFIWRDGPLLADTAFYGWLFTCESKGRYPLASLHYHPSHKPVHLLTPCRVDRDLTDRQLPGAMEFDISEENFDPRQEGDRLKMVVLFCKRCGIILGEEGLLQ